MITATFTLDKIANIYIYVCSLFCQVYQVAQRSAPLLASPVLLLRRSAPHPDGEVHWWPLVKLDKISNIYIYIYVRYSVKFVKLPNAVRRWSRFHPRPCWYARFGDCVGQKKKDCMPMISAMLPLKGYRLTKHSIRSIRSGFVRVAIFYRGMLWRCGLVGAGVAHAFRFPHMWPISIS